MTPQPELIIVSPVFNESAVIEQFILEWVLYLRSLNVKFELRLYDDGSTDNSPQLIHPFLTKYHEVKYFKKANTGHGPTVMQGYQAAAESDWIFQIDSDHELPVTDFEKLWAERSKYDLLMGRRIRRNSSRFRNMLTRLTSIYVKVLAGNGINDVNTPYRLIRGEKLQTFLHHNNPENFAPNVIMSAYAIRYSWRIFEHSIIPLQTRQLKKRGYSLYLLKGGISTALELIRFSLKK